MHFHLKNLVENSPFLNYSAKASTFILLPILLIPLSLHAQSICEISVKVDPDDLTSYDRLGTSVAISGDGNFAVVGTPYFGEGDQFRAGKAYVYARNGDSWQLLDELLASDGARNDEFGYDVDISGDGSYIVVGAYADDNGTGGTSLNRGSIYVYQKAGNTWGNEQKLIPPGLDDSFQFGTSVAISRNGNYLVGGAPNNNEQVGNGGMLYIYKRTGSLWSMIDKTWPADLALNDKLGESVDMSDDGTYVIAGCRTHEVEGIDMGATYVFKNNGSDNWPEEDMLIPDDGDFFDRFGYAVSIDGSGQYAVVGAKDNDEISSDNGGAYIFKNDTGNWTLQQKILTSNLDDSGQNFCYSVAINSPGDVILVGDNFDDVNENFNTSNAGAVYVFTRTENTWSEASVMIAADRSSGDYFGESVDIGDDYLVIGAPNVDGNSNDDGAAYFNDYSCWRSPLSAGLLAYYPFNGNTDDEGGQGLNGTNVGGILTTDRFERPDSAILFDGMDDYVDIPFANGGNPLATYSFSGWINLASIPNNDDRYYFYYNETSDGKIALYIDANGIVYASHHDGSTWRQVNSTSIISANQWYQVGLTWDGQNLNLFINGFLEDTLAVSNLQTANIGASIGRQDYWYSVNFRNRGLFHGKIDEIRIYDRALTGLEMAQLYDLPGEDFTCAAVPTAGELSFMDGTNPHLDNNLDQGEVLAFPVAVYYITDDSIPGEGKQERKDWQTEVQEAFTFVNTLFADAKIQFDVSFEAIYKKENLTTYRNDIRQQYPYYPNLINVFLVDEIINGDTKDIAGLSNFPATAELNPEYPDDRVFINYAYLSDKYTLPHELGHFFGLFHTFQDTECNFPCFSDCGLDQIDPITEGDRCEDTPIDPLHLKHYKIFTLGCVPQCVSSFNPIFENTMSYYRKCAKDGNATLTQDQKERMYYFATTAREYIWNNNQSDLITLISPQLGNYNSVEPADILINLGDNVSTQLDLFYRQTGQNDWIFIESFLARPGTNLLPANAPLHEEAGVLEYEYLVQYNSNTAIYDIGSPILVAPLPQNSLHTALINPHVSCSPCSPGETVTITWNTFLANPDQDVLLNYTLNGVTHELIAHTTNTGFFEWDIPDLPETSHFNIGVIILFEEENTRIFDFLNQNETLTSCPDPQTCCSEAVLDIHDIPIASNTYSTTQSIHSSGTVATGSNVTFQAEQSITLQAGFHAQAGSTFLAHIVDCGPGGTQLLFQSPDLTPDKPVTSEVSVVENLRIIPNPFRSETTISYTLSEAQETKLVLTDMLGRYFILQPGIHQDAGHHEFRLSQSGLQSGLYLVQLHVGRKVLTRKVLVLQE